MYLFPSLSAFEKVVHYRGQEFLTKLVDTAGQVRLYYAGQLFVKGGPLVRGSIL
jgi:hypothetical protein